ncbi:MAG: VOC family protein [Planctomycetes bacterium]|nr:VOC family protein [Planctomycetota bacterium]
MAASRVDPRGEAAPALFPCLWFRNEADAAIAFYRTVFPDLAVVEELRAGAGGPLPDGSLLSATVTFRGQRLQLLNGRPQQGFCDAFSLVVPCETQAEIDRCWAKLCEQGGTPIQCGWLTDRFGLSWQVVPTALYAMLRDRDPARVGRVMQAMFPMQKLDLATLQAAYDGK